MIDNDSGFNIQLSLLIDIQNVDVRHLSVSSKCLAVSVLYMVVSFIYFQHIITSIYMTESVEYRCVKISHILLTMNIILLAVNFTVITTYAVNLISGEILC